MNRLTTIIAAALLAGVGVLSVSLLALAIVAIWRVVLVIS